jgi:hypothetical protein
MDTIVLPPIFHTVNYLKYTTFQTRPCLVSNPRGAWALGEGSRLLQRRPGVYIDPSVEDTKLSTNKQHSLSFQGFRTPSWERQMSVLCLCGA